MKKPLADAFVPRANNDYTPSLIQRFAMVLMTGLVLLTFGAANMFALFWQNSEWLVGAVLPSVVTNMTNEERINLDEPPLTRSAVLDAAATLKAEHMAAEGYFAHYSPGGISPWYWFDQVGYTYRHAGENLAVHFTDSAEVVEAWMNSPSHRANIVNDDYTEIGIGVAKGTYEGYKTVFVVQLFGTPGIKPPVAAGTETDASSSTEAAAKTATELAMSNEDVAAGSAATEVLGADSQTQAADRAETADASTAESEAPMENETADILTRPWAESDPEPVFIPPARTKESLPNAQLESLYSGTIATDTDAWPAPATVAGTTTQIPLLAQLATQPNNWLQKVYLGIGGLVIILLLVSVALSWRSKEGVKIWYGLGLLMLMSVLFTIHIYVTAGARIT